MIFQRPSPSRPSPAILSVLPSPARSLGLSRFPWNFPAPLSAPLSTLSFTFHPSRPLSSASFDSVSTHACTHIFPRPFIPLPPPPPRHSCRHPSLPLTLSLSLPFPPHLLLYLSKSRQHLASSILGEIQADILSRAITVTFDHRMTGEWLTLRHQSMNFSLSAQYNLQSVSAFSLTRPAFSSS